LLHISIEIFGTQGLSSGRSQQQVGINGGRHTPKLDSQYVLFKCIQGLRSPIISQQHDSCEPTTLDNRNKNKIETLIFIKTVYL